MYLLKHKCAVISVVLILVIIVTVSLITIYEFMHHEGNKPTRKGVTPMVINTWNFQHATAKAWELLQRNMSAVDAVEQGCTICEIEQCKKTVGYGGSPDEGGETTLDALIIDGATMDAGAVGGLRSVKSAISVARKVLDNTKHTLIVGDLATQFALNMGFVPESLQTNYSHDLWTTWLENQCQPNFWTNVTPDPTKTCGPYEPSSGEKDASLDNHDEHASANDHDTITMLAIDRFGNIAAGGSTNGLIHKIQGRVGDTPVPGAGAYADNDVGAASATGNGDIMMRFLPSFLAVEMMRNGMSPQKAAESAINRILKHHPKFFGAVITVNLYGEFGAACNGMESFPFCVANQDLGVKNFTIPCST